MKLQKFRKNGKQKGIAIGCVIALLLTIAGVNLYRTFALYKEEKTFNVLRGVVPDFTHVTITYIISGQMDTKPPTKSNNYNVSVSCDGASGTWNSSSWELEVTNKTKKEITCTVTFTKLSYEDPILNGADPVLSGDLVAVKVDPSTGAVTKADTTQAWYNYKNKEWANAIIPTDSAKTTVKNYSAGKTITEDQIQSYFVWIPKYKYKIQTLGTSKKGEEKAFDIVFGTTNTSNSSTECATPIAPLASGRSDSCAVGIYMTHPAFLAFGRNGFWVGKFETGYKDANSKLGAEQSKADSTKVVIKPNQYSWRSIKVADMFTTAKKYQESLTSHMLKNTEWGAVAYLTNSIYGRCSNSTSCTEVTINNNSRYITGFAGASVNQSAVAADPGVDKTGTYNYKNAESVKASTTGNYTGVYDMSGGAVEYVMGVVADQSSKPYSGFTEDYDSGFVGPYSDGSGNKINGVAIPDLNYYDKYKYGTTENDATAYSRRILGDATAETKGWYSNGATFAYSLVPWFCRGDIFGFDYWYGNARDSYGFRIALGV